ncbi:hypothetical protein QEM02_002779 [Pseudomonas putida]|nr:hypothetical protein [Pseudomonas putida]
MTQKTTATYQVDGELSLNLASPAVEYASWCSTACWGSRRFTFARRSVDG